MTELKQLWDDNNWFGKMMLILLSPMLTAAVIMYIVFNYIEQGYNALLDDIRDWYEK